MGIQRDARAPVERDEAAVEVQILTVPNVEREAAFAGQHIVLRDGQINRHLLREGAGEADAVTGNVLNGVLPRKRQPGRFRCEGILLRFADGNVGLRCVELRHAGCVAEQRGGFAERGFFLRDNQQIRCVAIRRALHQCARCRNALRQQRQQRLRRVLLQSHIQHVFAFRVRQAAQRHGVFGRQTVARHQHHGGGQLGFVRRVADGNHTLRAVGIHQRNEGVWVHVQFIRIVGNLVVDAQAGRIGNLDPVCAVVVVAAAFVVRQTDIRENFEQIIARREQFHRDAHIQHGLRAVGTRDNLRRAERRAVHIVRQGGNVRQNQVGCGVAQAQHGADGLGVLRQICVQAQRRRNAAECLHAAEGEISIILPCRRACLKGRCVTGGLLLFNFTLDKIVHHTAGNFGFLRRSAGENQQRCEHQSQQTACEIACVHRSQSIPSD